MLYHFQIVSSVDPTDIYMDSKNWLVEGGINGDEFKGFADETEAEEAGENKRFDIQGGYKDMYYVKTYPVAENIVEEDMLEGHAYPGHETWNDDYHDVDDENYQL